MEGLLTIFVGLTALAVVTQAVVLVGIYLNSKRMSEQMERFMQETREAMIPVKSITENLRIASSNLVDIAAAAREQFRRVEAMVTETGDALHTRKTLSCFFAGRCIGQMVAPLWPHLYRAAF